MARELIELPDGSLPADSHSYKLRVGVGHGLDRLIDLVSHPMDLSDPKAIDHKLLAIQKDAALGLVKTAANLWAAQFSASQTDDNKFRTILQAIKDIQKKGKPKQ